MAQTYSLNLGVKNVVLSQILCLIAAIKNRPQRNDKIRTSRAYLKLKLSKDIQKNKLQSQQYYYDDNYHNQQMKEKVTKQENKLDQEENINKIINIQEKIPKQTTKILEKKELKIIKKGSAQNEKKQIPRPNSSKIQQKKENKQQQPVKNQIPRPSSARPKTQKIKPQQNEPKVPKKGEELEDPKWNRENFLLEKNEKQRQRSLISKKINHVIPTLDPNENQEEKFHVNELNPKNYRYLENADQYLKKIPSAGLMRSEQNKNQSVKNIIFGGK